MRYLLIPMERRKDVCWRRGFFLFLFFFFGGFAAGGVGLFYSKLGAGTRESWTLGGFLSSWWSGRFLSFLLMDRLNVTRFF